MDEIPQWYECEEHQQHSHTLDGVTESSCFQKRDEFRCYSENDTRKK